MEKAPRYIRYFLFAGILLVLLLPFVQSRFGPVETEPLKGAIPAPEEASFSLNGWLSGDYQKKQELYLNETFGFRSVAIRLNNELGYRLFRKAKANGVIVGKEGYLYEENYIDAYYGSNYIGYDSIYVRVQRFKSVQDTLQALGKSLVLIVAPGKGSYYPEYFPDRYKREKKTTNYETWISLARQSGLNLVDFNRYFLEHKKTSAYPLYPKYGIHWSYYGMCLAADSLVRYVEGVRHIRMRRLYWEKIHLDNARDTDYDIADGMNLLSRLKGPQMAYPELLIEPDRGQTKPSLLVVSDSFYWGLFKSEFVKAFSENQFWYYNKQVFPELPGGVARETKDMNLAEEIARHDIILVMCTEAKLNEAGWGFIEDAYRLFYGEKRVL